MKSLLVISLLLVLGLNGFGQDFLLKNKSDVKVAFECLANYYSDINNPPWSFQESKETIIATMNDSNKFEATFFFRYVSDESTREKLCDSIVIKYYCKECFDDNLSQILNSDNKWRKVDDNYYVTKKKFLVTFSTGCGTWYKCGVLNVLPSDEKDVSLKLQFSLVDFDRKEWKKLIKN